jgi:riboflavin kinase
LNDKTDIIHLPDLLFIEFCKEQFGINRGVYNTIDSWFFQKGIVNILERRHKIHDFLTKWIQESSEKKHGEIKIGHGNLTKKLNEYINPILS